MLLTVMGWKTLLVIFAYADFIALSLIVGFYITHRKGESKKEEYKKFVYREVFPFLLVQCVMILIMYIL